MTSAPNGETINQQIRKMNAATEQEKVIAVNAVRINQIMNLAKGTIHSVTAMSTNKDVDGMTKKTKYLVQVTDYEAVALVKQARADGIKKATRKSNDVFFGYGISYNKKTKKLCWSFRPLKTLETEYFMNGEAIDKATALQMIENARIGKSQKSYKSLVEWRKVEIKNILEIK